MTKLLKFAFIALIFNVLLLIIYGMVKSISGNVFDINPFIGSFILIAGTLLVYCGFHAIRKLWFLSIILIPYLESCNYAKSNQQVVVSDDCGMSWKKINAGDAVPKAGLNYCYMKVVIPNYPMQGDSKFITNLKDKVRANVHIDYDYSISDALSFIKQAKYLGKANTNADDPDAINEKGFESAENMVIDKRIKDVAKQLFINEDIVELDQNEIEGHLLVECNKVLEPLGVHLNFITLTFDLDEQTREAIDVSTAMKVYTSKGIGDIGKDVIKQRAGATKIIVENKTEIPKNE